MHTPKPGWQDYGWHELFLLALGTWSLFLAEHIDNYLRMNHVQRPVIVEGRQTSVYNIGYSFSPFESQLHTVSRSSSYTLP